MAIDYEDISYPPESWQPRDYQLPVAADLSSDIPNIFVVGHRQMGKDDLFLRGAATSAMETPGSYVYCLPTKVEVRENMWEAVNPATGVERMDEVFPPDIRLKKLDQAMAVELPIVDQPGKHSRLMFTGSDNHKSLRGAVARSYTFSEWAFCDPQALGVVRPIVEANKGVLRFVTSPFGQNHAYKMLVENARKPDWRCYLITNQSRHPLMEDPHAKGIIHIQSHRIAPERMRNILEENIQLYGPEIGQALTNQEYECSFDEIVPGSFYLDLLLKMEREGRLMSIAPRPDLPVIAAFDLGYADPTAMWYVQIKSEGWIDVIDYDEVTRTSIPELIPDLRRKPWYYSQLLLPHDGPSHHVTSQYSSTEQLTTAGFTCNVMPRTDDGAQIPSVRQLLPRCRFNNTPAVQRGLECLRHFHNKAKTEGGRTSWSPKPVHDWSSHGAKAFATLAYFAGELSAGVAPAMSKKDPIKNTALVAAGGWMA